MKVTKTATGALTDAPVYQFPSKKMQATLPRTAIIADGVCRFVIPSWLSDHDLQVKQRVAHLRKSHKKVVTNVITPKE